MIKTKNRKRVQASVLAVFMLLSLLMGLSTGVSAQETEVKAVTAYSSDASEWDKRHTLEEFEEILTTLNEVYPEYTTLESIGESWEEKDMWLLTVTDSSVSDENKTGMAVLANIHGGERETAEGAVYTASWFLENIENPTVQEILEKHILYFVPVINPDGYQQSFLYNTRYNMRPTDRDGDGIPFSDNYKDIDGDGYIATVYAATAADRSAVTGTVGMESDDANGDGLMGNDVKSSGIDLNRNFDFLWEENTISTKGPAAASEPETQAIQDFIDNHQLNAINTLHTGIQCVLYPWGYRDTDESNPEEVADIAAMAATAEKMRSALETTTHRNFYAKNSYNDYQTYSEMIDYAYGKYGIHTYTVEIYSGGSNSRSAYDPTHDPEDDSVCKWNNTLPEAKWVFYSHDEIASVLGLDWTALKKTISDGSVVPLDEEDGLYFYTTSAAQMVDQAPEDQYVMVQGVRESVLQMIYCEGDVDDPAETSVYQEPSQESLMNLLEKVSGQDGIGPHSLGTPEEKAVAELIVEQFQSFSPDYQTRVIEQTLVGTNYASRITTLGNILFEDDTWSIYGPYFGPSDRDFPADAEIVDCGTGTEAEFPANLAGKIALIERTASGTASSNELAAIALAEEKGAAGIIYTCKDYQVKSGGSSQMRGTTSNIPMMLIIKEYAEILKENFDKVQEVTKFLVDKTHSAQAILPAKSGKADGTVYVISHLDGVIGTVGANDNGSGTAAVMELARLYASVESNVEIRFMCFGGEESGLLGSRLFAQSLTQEEIDNTICVLNMDMLATSNPDWSYLSAEVVNGQLNLSSALMLNSVGELPWLPKDNSYRLYRYGSTDHQSFDEVGIDAAGMFRGDKNENSEPPNHTAADTIENNISPERLLQGASIISKSLATVLDANPSKTVELETQTSWNKASIVVSNTDQITGLSDWLTAEVTDPDGETYDVVMAESTDLYQFDVEKAGTYTIHFYSTGTGVTNWGNMEGETYAEDTYTIELGTYTLNVQFDTLNTRMLTSTVAYADNVAATGGLNNVIESVVTEFNRALGEAKSILARIDAGDSTITQDEVDDVAEALVNVIHYLEFTGDKTTLVKLIATAEKYEAQKDTYIVGTYTPFAEALRTARSVMADGDALDAEIEEAWQELYRTMLELRTIPDKSLLAGLLDTAGSVNISLYTRESSAVLLNAIDFGNMVMANENATENDVAEAASLLSGAMDRLEFIPTANGGESETDNAASGGQDAADETQTATGSSKGTSNPKTGDSTAIPGIVAVTLAGFVVMVLLKKKSK